MKKKVSILTHQDCIDHLVPGVRSRIAGPFEGPGGRKQHHAATAKKLETLSRPLQEEAVQQIFKDANYPEGWWKKSYKPGCDLCEEQHKWVLVIHEALEDEYPMNLHVCGKCINKLMEKKLEHLEGVHAELVAKVVEEDEDA
jgi:hypothetical protein